MGNHCCTPDSPHVEPTYQTVIIDKNQPNIPNENIAKLHPEPIKLNQVVLKQIQKLGPMVYKSIPQHQSEKLPPYIFIQGEIIYDGEWKNGHLHGTGKVYFPDSTYFEGTFLNGNANGEGRYIFENGDYYYGEIGFNTLKGKGVLVTDNGNYIYEGEFENNLANGNGIEKEPYSIFQGTFKNGEKITGKLIWGQSQEYCYIGDFKNNMFNGTGSLISPIGKYYGDFLDGKKQGQGQFIWDSNNFRYKGPYKNDKKHGQQGYLYDGQGLPIFKGTWENDQPKQGKHYVNGQQIFFSNQINHKQ